MKIIELPGIQGHSIPHYNGLLILLTLKSGYLGKVFSRSQHIQQGLKTLKKALMKKSPQNMDMMVKRRSIMVNLTSSCPNIVSQHNFLSLIFSLRSFWYWLVTTEQSSRDELGDGQVWSLPRFISAFSHRRRLAFVDQGVILFSQVHSFRHVSHDFTGYQSLYPLSKKARFARDRAVRG